MVDTPPQPFLSSSDIEGAPCGVHRGWSMTEVDFASSNTFVAVPGCTQSSVVQVGGHCDSCPTSF